MARIAAVLLLIGIAQATPAQQPDAYSEVESRVNRAFDDTLAEYGERIAANPGDIALRVRRCQVSDAFVYATEYYVEAAADDAAACIDNLLAQYPGLIEVEIAALAELSGDDAISAAEKLHDSGLWLSNTSQHAEIHRFLAVNHNFDEARTDERAEHCITAIRLDRSSDCRPQAARYLIDIGNPERATALLTSALDPNSETWYLLDKIAILSELDAADGVRRLYEQIDFESLDDYEFVELASGLADAGLRYEALAALNRVGTDYWDQENLAQTRYEVALALGDFDAALQHYNLLRDLGMHTDPFLRTRIELAAHDITLPWKARDALAIFPILGVTLLLAAITWLIPAVVHYRGLARRARALGPGLLHAQWGLRNAWYVLFAIAFGSVLTLFIYEYDVLVTEFSLSSHEMADWAGVDVVRLLIAESFIVAALLIPLLLTRERLRQFWTVHWSVARCMGVAFAAAVLLRITYAIPVYLWNEFGGAGQAITTEEAIAAMYVEHGAVATYLLIALLTPLVEELMFRGVLLQGFAQHLSWRWANILQALIFAGLHDNVAALPLLFAFGLVAGILVRKAGGLLPAVLLHIFFNVTAIVALASGAG